MTVTRDTHVTTERAFASDLYQLLERGFIEVETDNDAVPLRVWPTVKGQIAIAEDPQFDAPDDDEDNTEPEKVG